MNVDATELREVVNRHRVQGRVDGLGTMIEDGRDCRDVVRQFAAATRALERAGARHLVANLTACLRDEEAAAAEGPTGGAAAAVPATRLSARWTTWPWPRCSASR